MDNENQIEQPLPQENYQAKDTLFNTIKQNKRLVLFFVVGVVLLIIIFIATNPFLTGNSKIKEETPIPTRSEIPTTTDKQPSVTPITSAVEKETIKTAAKPQIDTLVGGASYTMSQIKIYTAEWAIVEITNPNTDPANVVLKKTNGEWKVVMGPGTHFDNSKLLQIGAPQNLINEANSRI